MGRWNVNSPAEPLSGVLFYSETSSAPPIKSHSRWTCTTTAYQIILSPIFLLLLSLVFASSWGKYWLLWSCDPQQGCVCVLVLRKVERIWILEFFVVVEKNSWKWWERINSWAATQADKEPKRAPFSRETPKYSHCCYNILYPHVH